MEQKPLSEIRALRQKLDAAPSADVPDLAEFRRLQERILRCLVLLVLERMQAHEQQRVERPVLTVIANDTPHTSVPRGICSPVKTAEIRRFEASAKAVFGDIASCTTTREDRYLGSE